MTDRLRETMSAQTASDLDPILLEILRCPLTHSKLRADGDFLVAEVGGLAYPVRDGIPVMLMEEAKLPAGVGSLDELKAQLKEQGMEEKGKC
jgi:uncharacterized protein YbaR (Trm112 family)